MCSARQEREGFRACGYTITGPGSRVMGNWGSSGIQRGEDQRLAQSVLTESQIVQTENAVGRCGPVKNACRVLSITKVDRVELRSAIMAAWKGPTWAASAEPKGRSPSFVRCTQSGNVVTQECDPGRPPTACSLRA